MRVLQLLLVLLLQGDAARRERRHDPQLGHSILLLLVLVVLLVVLDGHGKLLRLLMPGAAAGGGHIHLLRLDLRQRHRQHLLLLVPKRHLEVLLQLLQVWRACRRRLQPRLETKTEAWRSRSARRRRLQAAVVLAQPVPLQWLLLAGWPRLLLLLDPEWVLLPCVAS